MTDHLPDATIVASAVSVVKSAVPCFHVRQAAHELTTTSALDSASVFARLCLLHSCTDSGIYQEPDVTSVDDFILTNVLLQGTV